MKENVVLLLATLVCNGISCYLGYQLLGTFSFSTKIREWFILIGGIIGCALIWYLMFNMKAYSQVSLLSLWLIPFLMNKNRRKLAFVLYPFIYFATSTLASIGTFILMLINHSSFEKVITNFGQMMIILGFQLTIMCLFYIIKQFFARNAYILLNIRQVIIFYAVIFCSVTLLSIIVALEAIVPSGVGMSLLLVFASIASVTLLFLAVYQAYLNTNQQLLREKNQLQIDFQRMQQMYYESILKQNEDIRRFKHDFNGHLQTIRYLNSQKSSQELEHYLQKIVQQANIHLQTKYTGNKVVDILLLDLCNQAHLNEIEVRIDGYLPNQLFIEDFDLTTICFNLFKNALEAVSQVSVQEERVIDIFVDYVDQTHFVMEIKNTISQKVEIKDNQITTSKADGINHGIGLKNVAATVEKYEGYLSLASSEKVFSVKLFM